MVVLDSSVVFKWYFEEVNTLEALTFLNPNQELCSLDLMYLEVLNAACKRARRGDIPQEYTQMIRRSLAGVPIRIEPMNLHVEAALNLALQLTASIYDCAFLACAGRLGCPLVTADQKFYAAAVRASIPIQIEFLGNL